MRHMSKQMTECIRLRNDNAGSSQFEKNGTPLAVLFAASEDSATDYRYCKPQYVFPSGEIRIIGENFVLLALTVKEAEHEKFVPSTSNVNPCFPAVLLKSSASLPFGPNLKEPILAPSIDTSMTPGGFQGWLVADIVQLRFFPSCTGSRNCAEAELGVWDTPAAAASGSREIDPLEYRPAPSARDAYSKKVTDNASHK